MEYREIIKNKRLTNYIKDIVIQYRKDVSNVYAEKPKVKEVRQAIIEEYKNG
jgi:hypothetical protein